MDVRSVILTSDLILLGLVAFFVMAGLAISLIAITLTSIKESEGRTPQWPVSWPDSPTVVPRQRIHSPAGHVLSHSGSVTVPPQKAGEHPRRVDLPQRIEVPERRPTHR